MPLGRQVAKGTERVQAELLACPGAEPWATGRRKTGVKGSGDVVGEAGTVGSGDDSVKRARLSGG